MKSFKHFLTEVMTPNETIPFLHKVTQEEPDHNDEVHTHTAYQSTIPGKEHDHMVFTSISHDGGRNTHHIQFKVNGGTSRAHYEKSDHGLGLRVYSAVLAHMKHYTETNPNAKNFTFSMNRGITSKSDRSKTRLYKKIAKKFNINLEDIT